MPPKRKDGNSLGKAIIRERFGHKKKSGRSSNLHTTDFEDGFDMTKVNIKSVTEENTLDDFLSTAELASTQFNAERLNATTIVSIQNTLPSREELDRNIKIQMEHRPLLRIPRRSKWNESISAEELDEMERQAFLEWRRGLAILIETEGIIMTPYEKNIEFWRQLWRVIERSDVVVQIVDARNPLLFRCEDLEKYVKEVDSKKRNVILINKADFLTESQRNYWLDYFKDQDLTVYFWSALKQLEEVDEDAEVTDLSLLTKTELLECFRMLGREMKGEDELVTIGLIGYPNVGKSSTMNALLTERVVPENAPKSKIYRASVSMTPGKTKHFQTFFIDEKLLLCDCPGLVMPNFVSSKAEMITNGILPIDQMQDHLPPVSLVCSAIPRRFLELTYGLILPLPDEDAVSCDPTPHQLLTAYAKVRGFMTHKGIPDGSRAARIILKDYVSGKLCYCHGPPGSTEEEYGSRPVIPDNIEIFMLREAMETKKTAKVTRGVEGMLMHKEIEANRNQTQKELAEQREMVIRNEGSVHDLPKKHFNKNKKQKLRRIYKDNQCDSD